MKLFITNVKVNPKRKFASIIEASFVPSWEINNFNNKFANQESYNKLSM